MKWVQSIDNNQKSALGGPRKKHFVLQSCFFYVLPRHTNLMIDKVFNFLMNMLPDLYICPLRKKSAPLLPEGTVQYKHLAA